MRLSVKKDVFWYDVIYDWNNNKARRRRRNRIQKAKRSTRRIDKQNLKNQLKD